MPVVEMKTKFWDFGQNNSGGRFYGPAYHVIVEALDYQDANRRAEKLGLYFEGCSSGQDCECCGDRWSEQFEFDKGDETPSIYGEPVENYKDSYYKKRVNDKYPTVLIKYIDGNEKTFE